MEDNLRPFAHTDYRFVKIQKVVWQRIAGSLYHITFQARNTDKEYRTFQASLYSNECMREVQRLRMKGSSTWYLRELSY
ncbi:hypothetical protein LIER_42262 [Lithospermum erythrorhizon]|uniref:Uncharacterized protein n=1 Tax=Lithospermum erythrorhizon TaxID=34254 RepID=A0AAV3RSI2_LITER